MPNRDKGALLIRKADADLASAKALYGHYLDDEGVGAENVMFHVQQAAEKYLKALLALHDVQCPFKHDMRGIFRQIQDVGLGLPEGTDVLIDTAVYASVGRYEGVFEEIDAEMFDAYLACIETLKAYVAGFNKE